MIDGVGRVGAVLRRLVGRLVGKRPFRAVEAEADAVALRRKPPFALQKTLLTGSIDPIVVGAGANLDLPAMIVGDCRLAGFFDLPAGHPLPLSHGNFTARFQRHAVQPAAFAEHKGRARPEERRRVDTAGDGQIGARAGQRRAEFKHLPGADGDAVPERHRRAVKFRRHVAAAQGDHGGGVEAQRGADELAFERGIAGRVADQDIGQAERPMIDWPGRREAHTERPFTPRIVLNAGLETGLQDFNHRPGHRRGAFTPVRSYQ